MLFTLDISRPGRKRYAGRIAQLSEADVDWLVLGAPPVDKDELMEAVAGFGEEVIGVRARSIGRIR
jgi:hypothetical protein